MGKYDKVLSDPRYSGLNDSDKALFWDKIFKRDIATDSRYGSLNESEKATAYSKFLSKYMTPTDNAPASVIPEGIGKMNLLDEKTTAESTGVIQPKSSLPVQDKPQVNTMGRTARLAQSIIDAQGNLDEESKKKIMLLPYAKLVKLAKDRGLQYGGQDYTATTGYKVATAIGTPREGATAAERIVARGNMAAFNLPVGIANMVEAGVMATTGAEASDNSMGIAQAQREQQEKYPENVISLENVLGTTVEMLPLLAASFVSAGSAYTTALTKGLTGKAAINVAQRKAAQVSGEVMFAQSFKNNFNNVIKDNGGKLNYNDLANITLNSAADAASEAVGDYIQTGLLFKLINKGGKDVAAKTFGQAVKKKFLEYTYTGLEASAIEGIEELANVPMNYAIDYATGYRNNFDGMINDMTESFVLGGLATIPLSVLGGGAVSYNTYKLSRIQDKVNKWADIVIDENNTSPEATIKNDYARKIKQAVETARSGDLETAISILESVHKESTDYIYSRTALNMPYNKDMAQVAIYSSYLLDTANMINDRANDESQPEESIPDATQTDQAPMQTDQATGQAPTVSTEIKAIDDQITEAREAFESGDIETATELINTARSMKGSLYETNPKGYEAGLAIKHQTQINKLMKDIDKSKVVEEAVVDQTPIEEPVVDTQETPIEPVNATVNVEPTPVEPVADQAPVETEPKKSKPRLVSVEWRSSLQEVPDSIEGSKISRRSDWDNSEVSELSGREIVYVFWVEDESGKVKPYGIRSASKMLGLTSAQSDRLMRKAKAEWEAKQKTINHWRDTAKKGLGSDSLMEGLSRYPNIERGDNFWDNADKDYVVATREGKYQIIPKDAAQRVEGYKLEGWEISPIKETRAKEKAAISTPKPKPKKVEPKTKKAKAEPKAKSVTIPEKKQIPILKSVIKEYVGRKSRGGNEILGNINVSNGYVTAFNPAEHNLTTYFKTDMEDGLYQFIGNNLEKSNDDIKKYPQVADIEKEYKKARVKLDLSPYLPDLFNAMKFVSKDINREVLMGELLSYKDGKLTVAATDGRIVFERTYNVNIDTDPFDIIIPSKTIEILGKTNDSSPTIGFRKGTKDASEVFKDTYEENKIDQIIFKFNGGYISSGIVGKPYPMFRKAYEMGTRTTFTVNRSELLKSITEIIPYTDSANNNRISVAETDTGFDITAYNKDTDFTKTISVIATSKPYTNAQFERGLRNTDLIMPLRGQEISYDAKYLNTIISAGDTETVDLHIPTNIKTEAGQMNNGRSTLVSNIPIPKATKQSPKQETSTAGKDVATTESRNKQREDRYKQVLKNAPITGITEIAEAIVKVIPASMIKSKVINGETMTVTMNNGRVVVINAINGAITDENGNPRYQGQTTFSKTNNIMSIIDIAKEFNRNNITAYHESFHLAFNLFLTPQEQKTIIRAYGWKAGLDVVAYEELAAKDFEQIMMKNKISGGTLESRSLLHKLWSSIKSLARRMFGRDFMLSNMDVMSRIQNADYAGMSEAESAIRNKLMESEQSEPVAYTLRTDPAPKETITVYKAFQLINGKLYPMYVGASDPLPMGVYLDATEGGYHFTSSNGRRYVPALTGTNVDIPNDKVRSELIKLGYLPEDSTAVQIKVVAFRPGWHGGNLPFFPQGGVRDPLYDKDNRTDDHPYPNYHGANTVICEVEFDADYDYKQEYQDTAERNKKGEIIKNLSGLRYIPKGGYYEYATNPLFDNRPDLGNWAISGSMKINRIMSNDEAHSILESQNVPKQRWITEVSDNASKKSASKTSKSRNIRNKELEEYDAVVAKYKGTDQWLKAPNGEPTNLNERQWVQVRTPQFKAWFGDWLNDPKNASKVVDENGEPATVWHGGKFNESMGIPNTEGRARKNWQLSFGMHFSKNKTEAEQYQAMSKGSLTEAFLNVKNPLLLHPSSNEHGESVFHPITKDGYESMPTPLRKIYDKQYGTALKETSSGYGYTEWIENSLEKMKPQDAKNTTIEMGYDGILYEARANLGLGKYRGFESYIAFSPTQIKSATANVGEFSSSNPDIRYSELEEYDAVVAKYKGTDQWLKAPNGEPTNLNERQWVQVRTPQFKAWFGDWLNDPKNASKVVDENGEPLVVYHGTNNESFNSFDPKAYHIHDSGFYGRGIYFTFATGDYRPFSKAEAEYYGSRVIEAYLDSRNPFIYDEEFLRFNGVNISYMGNDTLCMLYNIAKKFPELESSITLPNRMGEYDPKNNSYEEIPISFKEYVDIIESIPEKLKIQEVNDRGETYQAVEYITGEKISYVDGNGKTHVWDDTKDIYHKIENNSDMKEVMANAVFSAADKIFGISADYHPEGYMTRHPEITDIIKSKGYDGILQTRDGDEAVVFSPTQIKSATANVGTFDKANPDIRYSELPLEDEAKKKEAKNLRKAMSIYEKINASNTAKDLKSVLYNHTNFIINRLFGIKRTDSDYAERLTRLLGVSKVKDASAEQIFSFLQKYDPTGMAWLDDTYVKDKMLTLVNHGATWQELSAMLRKWHILTGLIGAGTGGTFDTVLSQETSLVKKLGQAGSTLISMVVRGRDIQQRMAEDLSLLNVANHKLALLVGAEKFISTQRVIIQSKEDGNTDAIKKFSEETEWVTKEITDVMLDVFNAMDNFYGQANELIVKHNKKAETDSRIKPIGVIENYFPHMMNSMIDNSGVNEKNLLESNTPKLGAKAALKRDDPESQVNVANEMDITKVANRYFRTMGTLLAYDEAYTYYTTKQINIDMGDVLYKKYNIYPAQKFLKSVFHPDAIINEEISTVKRVKSRLYVSMLMGSLKFTLLNPIQRFNTLAFVSKSAGSLAFANRRVWTGRVNEVDMPFTSALLDRFGISTGESLLKSAEVQARQALLKDKDDNLWQVLGKRGDAALARVADNHPGFLAEIGNWNFAFTGGVYDYVMNTQEYKDAVSSGMTKKDAIESALANPDIYEDAYVAGVRTCARVNPSQSPAFTPELFNRDFVKTFTMFARFSMSLTQNLIRTTTAGRSSKLPVVAENIYATGDNIAKGAANNLQSLNVLIKEINKKGFLGSYVISTGMSTSAAEVELSNLKKELTSMRNEIYKGMTEMSGVKRWWQISNMTGFLLANTLAYALVSMLQKAIRKAFTGDKQKDKKFLRLMMEGALQSIMSVYGLTSMFEVLWPADQWGNFYPERLADSALMVLPQTSLLSSGANSISRILTGKTISQKAVKAIKKK